MDDVNPYRAPETAVERRQLPEHLELASRGARLLAALIDTTLALLATAPSHVGTLVSWDSRRDTATQFLFGGAAVSALLALVLLAIQGFHLQRHGATLGKRALRLRIVRTDGSRADFTHAFWLRVLAPALIYPALAFPPCCCGAALVASPLLIPLLAIDVAFILRHERRCVHDYMADTLVVKAWSAGARAEGGPSERARAN